MEYRVDPQLQSGSPTAGDDCCFQCGRGAIRALSDGAIVPSIHELRGLAGVPTGGIPVSTCRDLINHYIPGAARFSRTIEDLWATLAGGSDYLAVVAINHRVLNELWPELSGDLRFNGSAGKPALHAIGLQGWERVIDRGTRGPWWIKRLDPLGDGRVRDKHRYPKQIDMVRQMQIETLVKAVPNGVQIVLAKHP